VAAYFQQGIEVSYMTEDSSRRELKVDLKLGNTSKMKSKSKDLQSQLSVIATFGASESLLNSISD